MSILDERTPSVNLGDVQPSSITQRFYLDNAQLSTKQATSNELNISGSSSQPNTDTSSSNLATQVSNYGIGQTEKFFQQPGNISYYGHSTVNWSVPTVLNTLRSNYVNTVTQASQPTLNGSATNYFDLFSSRSNMSAPSSTHSSSYYNPNDFCKVQYVNNLQSNTMECVPEYMQNNLTVNEYSDRNQSTIQATQLVRQFEPSYIYTCPPGLDNTQMGYGVDQNDLCSRYTDALNRTGRHGLPVYQLGTQEDPLSQTPAGRPGNAVELLVSNLDYNIGAKEWRKILFTQLQSTIKSVHSIVIQTQVDGTNCAVIKVGSIEDARLIISHFHRKKIGYKRIQVNIVSPNGSLGTKGMKIEVVSLLRSVSGNSLPVYKFIDLFEKRFHRNISVSDLYKMRDVIEIKEQPGSQGGRLVVLSARAQRFDRNEVSPNTDPVVCRRHCIEGSEEYARAIDCSMLPCVLIPLNLFRQQVIKLLQDHDGSLPLISFPACYKAEFGELPIVLPPVSQQPQRNLEGSTNKSKGTDGKEVLPSDSVVEEVNSTTLPAPSSTVIAQTELEISQGGTMMVDSITHGVPLEHLITCVPFVRIRVEANGVRKIVYDCGEPKDQSLTNQPLSGIGGQQQSSPALEFLQAKRPNSDSLSPMTNSAGQSSASKLSVSSVNAPGVLQDQLHQFSREMVDLLKHQPECQILLSKFIPSYHHHFGKQCRVADYGYSKLHELIDALPNVVHVMGSGHMRLLTLSHRVQVRRFTNELIKVLKSQSTKSCRLTDYANIYRRIYRKVTNPL